MGEGRDEGNQHRKLRMHLCFSRDWEPPGAHL